MQATVGGIFFASDKTHPVTPEVIISPAVSSIISPEVRGNLQYSPLARARAAIISSIIFYPSPPFLFSREGGEREGTREVGGEGRTPSGADLTWLYLSAGRRARARIRESNYAESRARTPSDRIGNSIYPGVSTGERRDLSSAGVSREDAGDLIYRARNFARSPRRTSSSPSRNFRRAIRRVRPTTHPSSPARGVYIIKKGGP